MVRHGLGFVGLLERIVGAVAIGERIVVRFSGAGPSVGLPATIDGYDVKVPIPTTLQLPCSGPGTVAFVPSPTSATATSATVAITYHSSGV